MNNILVTSAGRRVELVRAFQMEAAAVLPEATVHAADLHPELSAACQIASAQVRMPRVSDLGYIDALTRYCLDHQIGLVVPTIDTELQVLADHRHRLQQQGIHVAVSDPDLVRMCRDKRGTVELFRNMGLDSPQILNRNALSFPCFVKPADGSSGIGAQKLASAADVPTSVLSDERMIFFDYVDPSFDEYTVDCYFDRTGRLYQLVPRLRLEVRAGEVSKGVTRKSFVHRQLNPIAARIEGARGCITMQVFARASDQRLLGIEVNARFGGGFPLSYSAGANFPRWLIQEYLLDQPLDPAPDWESDLLLLRYDAHVLVRDAK